MFIHTMEMCITQTINQNKSLTTVQAIVDEGVSKILKILIIHIMNWILLSFF